MSEAEGWALDAIRLWAALGIDRNGNYFGEITRDWAKTGDGKANVPACLGSVLDWCYLFSKGSNSSPHPHPDMYKVCSGVAGVLDLTNLYCWVFSGWLQPIHLTVASPQPKPPVDITSDRGLNPKYWDMDPNPGVGINTTDQTHHFAAYFWFGANFGTNRYLLNKALSATGDWSERDQKVINQGDYDLGYLAADWGKKMATNPGYLGKQIEASLR